MCVGYGIVGGYTYKVEKENKAKVRERKYKGVKYDVMKILNKREIGKTSNIC